MIEAVGGEKGQGVCKLNRVNTCPHPTSVAGPLVYRIQGLLNPKSVNKRAAERPGNKRHSPGLLRGVPWVWLRGRSRNARNDVTERASGGADSYALPVGCAETAERSWKAEGAKGLARADWMNRERRGQPGLQQGSSVKGWCRGIGEVRGSPWQRWRQGEPTQIQCSPAPVQRPIQCQPSASPPHPPQSATVHCLADVGKWRAPLAPKLGRTRV